ncbi:hypothetical protein AAKU52_002373 [Pedobacter sp. CG_S7]|uniref:DUF6876 family protein n=1 Tax=Pedobacter sp. CG_S7 TaxID=3143930 RepID=UPI003399B1DA
MENFKLNNTHEFKGFIGGSENFYKHTFGSIYTDGIKYLADTYECYWFLDIISIYSNKIKGEEFQVWNLKRLNETSQFKITVTDGNKNVLKTLDIPLSDFKSNQLDVWLVSGTIMLPAEY